MSNKQQIQFLVNRLKAFRSRLGGDKEQVLSPFETAHQKFRKAAFQFRSIQKNLQSYTGQRTADIIRLENSMKAARVESEKHLRQMEKELVRLEKEGNPVEEREKVRAAKEIFNMVEKLDNTKNKFQTLVDKKGMIALSDLTKLNASNSPRGSDDRFDEDQDDEVILQFEEEDKKIDKHLDQLINGIDLLGVKAKRMNEGIDQVQARQKKAGNQIDKVNADLDKKNAQLKQLLKHFGGGTNCCMTVFLALLLVGLVVVLINVALKLKK